MRGYFMVRDDIFGMLKTALQRGKPLQQSIQSLYNAGYSKEEVDEAARMLNTMGIQPVQQPVYRQPQKSMPQKQMLPPGQTQQMASYYNQQFQQAQQPPQPIQAVSGYGQFTKERASGVITTLMIVAVIVLLGILVAVFLFKPEITNFINNL